LRNTKASLAQFMRQRVLVDPFGKPNPEAFDHNQRGSNHTMGKIVQGRFVSLHRRSSIGH
jgi:hypothetical protein